MRFQVRQLESEKPLKLCPCTGNAISGGLESDVRKTAKIPRKGSSYDYKSSHNFASEKPLELHPPTHQSN
jgi:hypothetical protein